MAAAVPRFDTRIVAPLTKFSDETSLFGIWRAAISCRHEIIRKSNFKHVLVSTLFRGPGSSSLLWVVLDQITRQPLHRIVRTDLDKLGHAFKKDGHDGLVQVGTNRKGIHGITPMGGRSRGRSRSWDRGSDRCRGGRGGLLLGNNRSGGRRRRSSSSCGNWCRGGYRCRRLRRWDSGLRLGRSYWGSTRCHGCRRGSGGGSRRIGCGHVGY
mmetsp:Transcript_27351/g.78825  ORF Transcript_27351/g.78825 Transcript_27351/m.78825 type:complete len:211 (+) Transcript_27351:817-1449(+)